MILIEINQIIQKINVFGKYVEDVLKALKYAQIVIFFEIYL